MSLNLNILSWSKTQPPWQQDALRRIFERGNLSTTDLDELYAIAKDLPGTAVVPLSAAHMSASTSNGPVRVLSLTNMQNVNAFPAGRQVEFARDGITVLFGENGVGKSGYARVLKRACRARQAKAVMRNAFTPGGGNAPSAQISIEVGGSERKVDWQDGGPLDEDLASVVVYDAACAEAYVESEGEPSFQPFGLRALNELVRACKHLDERIAGELLGCRTDKTPFVSLGGDHSVGRLIDSLSRATDIATIKGLGTPTDADHARLRELGKVLLQSDPEPQAKAYEQLAIRVSTLATRLESADRFVGAGAVDKLSGYLAQAANAAENFALTRGLLEKRATLPGTGEKRWSTLMAAARDFSVADAYPKVGFPNVGDDAQCVLCQGDMTDQSRENLLDYEQFASSTAAQANATATQAVTNARKAIEAATADLGIDEATRKDIAEQGTDLLARIENWKSVWDVRRSAMLQAARADDLRSIASMPAEAANASDVRRFADELRARAQELRNSQDPVVREKLCKEHSELLARASLAPHVPALEKFVSDAMREHSLGQTKARFASGVVSRRMTELADQYISEELLLGMQEELKAIGYARSTRHKIPKRTSKGVTLFKIALEGSTHQVQEVLSEGEQRATAFAFFLAELRLSDKRSTLVFDDPVTSLDHRYRRQIAERLAELARERQVIVFTHDAVFLTNLQRAADRAACSISARHIEWDSGPGLTKQGLGWDLLKSSARLQAHREELAKIGKSWNEYPNETNKREIADAYDHLRGSMERMLRDSLMNDVIVPFSDEVKVEKFGAVIGMPSADWDGFLDIYDRACETMYGHDTTGEAQAAGRTPDQLKIDIDVLDRIVKAAENRARVANQNRNDRAQSRRKGVEALT